MCGAARFHQLSDSRLIHGARTTAKLRNLSVIDRSKFPILAPNNSADEVTGFRFGEAFDKSHKCSVDRHRSDFVEVSLDTLIPHMLRKIAHVERHFLGQYQSACAQHPNGERYAVPDDGGASMGPRLGGGKIRGAIVDWENRCPLPIGFQHRGSHRFWIVRIDAVSHESFHDGTPR